LTVENKDKLQEIVYLFQCKYSKNEDSTLKWNFLKEIFEIYFVSYKKMIENKISINEKDVDDTFKFVYITNKHLDSTNNVINHFKKINKPTNFIYDFKDAEYFKLCDYHDIIDNLKIDEGNLKIDEFSRKFILITRFGCKDTIIDDIKGKINELSENLDIDKIYKNLLEKTTKKIEWINQTQIENLIMPKKKRERSITNDKSSKKVK
jgi:hypothetical protein